MTQELSPVSAWESLFRAQVVIMRTLSAEFPLQKLSLNEYDVLFNLSIRSKSRLRIRDINQHLLLSQPTLSRLIDRLVARGFLNKSVDPWDGRGTIVSLTSEGSAVFAEAAAVYNRLAAEQITAALDSEEIEQLTTLCDKLKAHGSTS